MAILQSKMQEHDLLSIIALLKAENDALKAKKSERKLGLKVSEKGAVSLTGMRRFPTTLYKLEWFRVFDMVDEIKAFIKANESRLSTKTGDE
jgi:hypothetical protein